MDQKNWKIEKTKNEKDMLAQGTGIIRLPEYDKLKEEVAKLKAELIMFVLERDNLKLIECKNIETAYLLALGGLEYKAYELECAILRAKRKTSLIQERINRQEKINLQEIEDLLDIEFAEYQKALNKMLGDILAHSKLKLLSKDDEKEIKDLYYKIVKALHPDLHPNLTKEYLDLFNNAVSAYKSGDLEAIRIIYAMIENNSDIASDEDVFSALAKEKDRLHILLDIVKEDIDEVKSTYPYTVKALLDDPKMLNEKKAELEKHIAELKVVLIVYNEKLEEMMR